MGHRHAIYINVLKGMLMYIACLCPNLVSVHFYAIPIYTSKFLKFFIYLYNIKCMADLPTQDDTRLYKNKLKDVCIVKHHRNNVQHSGKGRR